eukprot:superscaffoldBa00000571_g5721
MKKEQVVNCQFSVWYPIFKKHTIKSVILPLPQNVIDYLLDDGTLVVSGSDHNTQQTNTNNSDSDAEEDIQWSDDETTTTVTAPEFPEFTSKVLEAINALGGRVFPKLNWSAPRDANWIALNSSLQCCSLSEIFLLFKSSDFITHDLTQPFLQCSDQDSPDPVINYEEGPAFRYTNSEVTVQPSPCLSYRIPRDFVDLSTGEDAYKLIDFLKLTKSQQEESEDEEEEENAPQ